MTINTLHRLDILISSEEEEESLDIVMDTEELGLGLARLPTMVWTLTKYKPLQMAEFISLTLWRKSCLTLPILFAK